jgi:Zn-dependent M32 family carboxypeptidase
MVNYGFGAILTAQMRQHISEALGTFDTGDSRWYGWLSERLLRYGSERNTRTLMRDFLGHPVSPQALLGQIHRLKPLSRVTARPEVETSQHTHEGSPPGARPP